MLSFPPPPALGKGLLSTQGEEKLRAPRKGAAREEEPTGGGAGPVGPKFLGCLPGQISAGLLLFAE